VMMRSLRKLFVVYGILLACLAIHVTSSLAASPGTAQGKMDPGIKKEVEQKLRVLSREISQKEVLNKEAVFVLLADYLSKNPHVHGAAFAFAPRKKGGELIKSSPYIHRSGEQFIKKDLIESYDYTGSNQKWYVVPVQQKKPVWSEPYFDKGGGDVWMVTYSIPIYSRGKYSRLIGVVTSDILIPNK
jgi:sigma-B regulation protein RsbU (phosphoserine phosphatase)